MKAIRMMIGAVALVAVLAPGAVLAQVVIDGVEVSPADLPRVRAQCNSLIAGQNRSLTSDEGADLIEPSPDPASAYSAGANSMDNALSDFNLNRLTVRNCRAAGFW
jgi:hypothetical protein